MSMNLSDFKSGIEQSMAALLSAPTPENELKFFADLQAARFLVPLGKGGGLAIISASNFDGGYIPAFTSERELRGGAIGSEAEAYSYHTLKYLVVDDLSLGGIAINPFGKQLILHRAQIEGIDSATSGMSARRTVDFEYVSISKPKECPNKLTETLSRKMKNRSEVYKLYIVSAARAGDNAPHLTFAVDFDGSEPQLFPLLAEIIRPFMRPGMYFELIKASYALMMQIDAAGIKPTYKKN